MKRAIIPVLTLIVLCGDLFQGRAEEPMRFKEVYDLVREHLAGVEAAELEEAAVQGLLEKLGPRVVVVDEATPSSETGKVEPLAWTTAYDGFYGYVRVQQVNPGLAEALGQALAGLTQTNQIKGLIVDLRYAGGEDYAAAAAAADLFFVKEQPMVDYGDGVKRSSAKESGMKVPPVALLINGQTESAAEVFAGILREAGLSLLLGEASAGRANLSRDFPLETGQTLRVATAAIKVGDGVPLNRGGVAPDIEVKMSEEDSLAYYQDAYALVSGSDPGSRRRRLNEAELVRMSREGLDLDLTEEELTLPEERPAPRILRDPVLGRAIDLLKGIAVVRRYGAP